jgi:hypothetical protein
VGILIATGQFKLDSSDAAEGSLERFLQLVELPLKLVNFIL